MEHNPKPCLKPPTSHKFGRYLHLSKKSPTNPLQFTVSNRQSHHRAVTAQEKTYEERQTVLIHRIDVSLSVSWDHHGHIRLKIVVP